MPTQFIIRRTGVVVTDAVVADKYTGQEIKIDYLPLDAVEDYALTQEFSRLSPSDRAKLVVDEIVKRVKRWDAVDEDGKTAPINEQSIRGLNYTMLDGLFAQLSFVPAKLAQVGNGLPGSHGSN